MFKNSAFWLDFNPPVVAKTLTLIALTGMAAARLAPLNAQPNAAQFPMAVSPVITSVTPIAPQASQIIIICGSAFGTQAPFDGDSPFIMVSDLARDWRAGCGGRAECGSGDNAITIRVGEWSDNEIHIEGFTGRYGETDRLRLNPGDEVELRVWNVQTGVGPAVYRLSVGAGADSPTAPPVQATGAGPPSLPLPALSAPIYAFNGAYVAYTARTGNTLIFFAQTVNDVDTVRQTFKCSMAGGAGASRTLRGDIVKFDQFCFLALSRPDLNQIRQGTAPPNLFPGPNTSLRHGVIVSVPAGRFVTEEISSKQGTLWVDSTSGVIVKLNMIEGAGGILGGSLGVAAPGGTAELTRTNVPMTTASSRGTLIYAAVIAGVVLLVAVTGYAFARGGDRRMASPALTSCFYSSPNTLAGGESGTLQPMPDRQMGTVAPTGQPPRSTRPISPITMEALDKVAKLKSLVDAGVITREEFEREKAKLLGPN